MRGCDIMFPITHIGFAEKVMNFRNSSVILGAVYPDIVITGCLDYKQTHYCGFELYDYLIGYCPDFARGMITHTVKPMGLDYYGDESYKEGYKGYCFQKAKLIVDRVIEACNIPESYGLWKAHNFVEMGIELNTIESQPYFVEELHKAIFDEAAMEQFTGPIEHYYGLKNKEIAESFKKLSHYIELDKSNCHTLAEKYNIQMQSKHSISIDVKKAEEIIESCRSIVENDIEEFFLYCSSKVKRMIEGGMKCE
jgi:hypothetical protein